jgi:NAD(P)-dependent dehydrogenase (short-subunit alcohol dehydrogenase family)
MAGSTNDPRKKETSTMDLRLTGKRALVTGSTSGIGEAIARALAREGVRVVVHGRREAETERVVADIERDGGRAVAVAGDVSTDEGARRIVGGVESAGGIDILVNNAGVWDGRAWLEVAPAEWVSLYETNVVSAVRLVRAFLPTFKSAGWGRFIQLASGVATSPPPGREPHYAATKAALVNLTVGLAKELAGSGVTANAISPGIILTSSIRAYFQSMAEREGWGTDWPAIEKRLAAQVFHNPSGRMGRPEEVANLVAFVASPLADFIQGANLRVDGGYVGSVT